MSIDPDAAVRLSATLCTSPVCRSPDIDLSDSVEVSSLVAEESSWKARGTVQIQYCVHGRCRTCGRVFEAAKKQIPVQFPEVACPKCDRTQFLRYRVEGVTRTPEGFEFVATVTCSGCKSANVLKRLLAGLLSAISIDVGLTGITIKKASGAG